MLVSGVTVMTGCDMISVTFTPSTLSVEIDLRQVRVTLCRWAFRP